MPDAAESATASGQLKNLTDSTGQPLLKKIARGIEKEGLRTTADGRLSTTPHPTTLGSALTNSWLTTDFSESLLEFITPVCHSVEAALQYLETAHAVAYRKLGDEVIWGASMPCILPADSQIPIAQYGRSNIAQMKAIYRRGLGHRYGRAMQTVAGIHYNFSLPMEFWQRAFDSDRSTEETKAETLQEYIDQRYLGLIRNFRRHYWLLIYLFGAAPCADRSFIQGRPHQLQSLGDNDIYLPFATSLRMGDLGYQSAAQRALFVCYNRLDTYIETLGKAIQQPYPAYQNIAAPSDDGRQQLSSALLQIENEFYSPIRPKRVTHSGETPLHALSQRGIEYIEVRCLDINPFAPLGINSETLRFLDAFLLYCLQQPSPPCDRQEFQCINENQSRIVSSGRDKKLMLYCGKKQRPMRNCALQLLEGIAPIAALLDSGEPSAPHQSSCAVQRDKLLDTALTPSAKILATMTARQQPYIAFGGQQSTTFRQHFLSQRADTALAQQLMQTAADSIDQQRQIEQSDQVDFEQFLSDYFTAAKLEGQ